MLNFSCIKPSPFPAAIHFSIAVLLSFLSLLKKRIWKFIYLLSSNVYLHHSRYQLVTDSLSRSNGFPCKSSSQFERERHKSNSADCVHLHEVARDWFSWSDVSCPPGNLLLFAHLIEEQHVDDSLLVCLSRREDRFKEKRQVLLIVFSFLFFLLSIVVSEARN